MNWFYSLLTKMRCKLGPSFRRMCGPHCGRHVQRMIGPVALPLQNGAAKFVEMNAGVVGPPGQDLPGLLGMDVLEARRAET